MSRTGECHSRTTASRALRSSPPPRASQGAEPPVLASLRDSLADARSLLTPPTGCGTSRAGKRHQCRFRPSTQPRHHHLPGRNISLDSKGETTVEPVTTTAPEQVRLGYLTCYGRGVRLNLQARCTCWWSGPRRTWGPDSIAEEQADLDTHLNQSAHHRLESGDRAATNLHGRCGHVHSLDDDCAVPYDSPAGQLVRACQATLTRPRAALDRRNQTRRMGGQPTRRSRNRSPPRQRRPRPHRSRRPPHRGRSHPTLGPAPRIPRQLRRRVAIIDKMDSINVQDST